ETTVGSGGRRPARPRGCRDARPGRSRRPRADRGGAAGRLPASVLPPENVEGQDAERRAAAGQGGRGRLLGDVVRAVPRVDPRAPGDAQPVRQPGPRRHRHFGRRPSDRFPVRRAEQDDVPAGRGPGVPERHQPVPGGRPPDDGDPRQEGRGPAVRDRLQPVHVETQGRSAGQKAARGKGV
ncbi:MAG: hypothetical protein AVDCRST_MAG88-3900, partial [uncultured Thermomicrobiales bacterium]